MIYIYVHTMKLDIHISYLHPPGAAGHGALPGAPAAGRSRWPGAGRGAVHGWGGGDDRMERTLRGAHGCPGLGMPGMARLMGTWIRSGVTYR